MYEERYVSAPITGRPCQHASSVEELANGDLLCAWYVATAEKNPDQEILISRLLYGASAWEPPRSLVRGEHAQGNPVLYQHTDGRLWLIYAEMVLPLDWEKCCVHILFSSDGGQAWTARRTLVPFLGYVPRNHPLCLRDGSVVLPLYDERKGRSVFLISRDGGEIWELGGDIITAPGNEQAALAELDDGTLVAYMRTRDAPGYIWEAHSVDGGWNWSPAVPTRFPNCDSAVDLVRLPNGHLVLAFNDSGTSRTPLSLALSTDEGKTWDAVAHLEDGPDSYDYPSLVVDRRSLIHVTYSYRPNHCIKHVTLDETWILQNAARRPNL